MTETQRKSLRARETLRRAVSDDLEKKRRLGQYAVICRNGRPVQLQPEQMPEQGND
jgi:hypothetical protein